MSPCPPLFLRLLLFPLLIAGCVHTPPPVSSGAAAVAATSVVAPVPLSFETENARISALLPVTSDTDQRDRLFALRELVEGMRGKDPTAQRVVHDYVAAVLTVEERGRPVVIGGGEGSALPIQEENLGETPEPLIGEVPLGEGGAVVLPATPAALDAARAAMTAAHYDEAIALLATIAPTDPAAADAAALRKTAVDEWARTTREKAGELFLRAQKEPKGPDRTAALTAARAQLIAINEKYPENSYAQQIRDNIARVDVELASTP